MGEKEKFELTLRALRKVRKLNRNQKSSGTFHSKIEETCKDLERTLKRNTNR